MPTMMLKVEAQPFLGYSDDPAQPATEDSSSSSPSSSSSDYHHTPAQARRCAGRARRLARDLLVFLLASLLWLAVLFLLLPRPPAQGPAPAQVQTAAGPTRGDFRAHNVTSGARFVSCGGSAAEARRAGCRYDALLNHWVPARCADQEWVDEYQDDGSWAAFADVGLTQELAPEAMGERDHYYTSVRDHVNHCAVLWRKQFWTLFEDRRAFDGVVVNTYHTEHCAQFLSDLLTMNRTEPTLVRVGFSGCWVREDGQEL